MRRNPFSLIALSLLTASLLTACSGADAGGNQDTDGTRVSLRNLTDTTSAAARRDYEIQGSLIPTPSDRRSRYYLLWQRRPMLSDQMVAIIRQENGSRIAYARVGVDCGRRLFHVLGVGNRRSFAEMAIAYDGPLRSVAGLPLRQELAAYVCEAAGERLADTR